MGRTCPSWTLLEKNGTFVCVIIFEGKILKILNLSIFLLLFPLASFGENAYIDVIPDFTQTDVTAVNSGNGQQYCAPVAVSNSIAWLSGKEGQQMELIIQLASKAYMNTSLKNGTGTTGVLRGVNRIAKELFGGYKTLEYQGWRKHPKNYSTGIKLPDIERIQSAVSSQSTAWLNVGWYRYNSAKNEYKRIGGHWVTLVGFEDNQLIIHDPSPRAGKTFANEYAEYSIIQNGMLVGNKKGLPTSATGYISLGEGFHIKSSADFAILDGVVYFALK